jgi:hypothetical protein
MNSGNTRRAVLRAPTIWRSGYVDRCTTVSMNTPKQRADALPFQDGRALTGSQPAASGTRSAHMLKGHRTPILSALTALLFVLLNVPSASAIPAFARKYQTSCQTCHIGFPKLNAFGEAFRLNGYRLPKETEDQIKLKPVSLGADAYKRLWPRAIYPSDLPGQVPLALNVKMASIFASSVDDTGRHLTRNEFQFPQEANLFSGGTLGEHIGFLGEVTWSENPDGSSETELERFHIQFGSLFGPEHLFNLKIGKFAPDFADGFHEMWLSTNNGIDTLFAFNPVGLNGGSELADSGGGVSLPENVKGIELYGVGAHRIFYTVGVANGLGVASGTTGRGSATKDVYARADYKFGGMALDGDTTGVTLPPENWRERSFRVGVLGYHGSGRGTDFPFTDDAGNTLNVQDTSFTRGGVYASWFFNDLNVFGVALAGRDHLDTFDADGARASSATRRYRTWFVQSDYVILPPLQASLRYENLNPADSTASSIRALNASLSYFIYVNVKATLEYHRDLHDSKDYDLTTILRFAF